MRIGWRFSIVLNCHRPMYRQLYSYSVWIHRNNKNIRHHLCFHSRAQVVTKRLSIVQVWNQFFKTLIALFYCYIVDIGALIVWIWKLFELIAFLLKKEKNVEKYSRFAWWFKKIVRVSIWYWWLHLFKRIFCRWMTAN